MIICNWKNQNISNFLCNSFKRFIFHGHFPNFLMRLTHFMKILRLWKTNSHGSKSTSPMSFKSLILKERCEFDLWSDHVSYHDDLGLNTIDTWNSNTMATVFLLGTSQLGNLCGIDRERRIARIVFWFVIFLWLYCMGFAYKKSLKKTYFWWWTTYLLGSDYVSLLFLSFLLYISAFVLFWVSSMLPCIF